MTKSTKNVDKLERKLVQADLQHVAELYSCGGYDSEVSAYLIEQGFSVDSFAKLYENEPEFAKTIDIGRVLALAWYEKMARLNIGNKHFNTPLWYTVMKQRFEDYKEKPVNHTVVIEDTRMNSAALAIIERLTLALPAPKTIDNEPA